MKKCPFCAKEDPDANIPWKHCGKSLDEVIPPPLPEQFRPWYFRTSSIVIVLCNLPPLALPMIWWRPQTTLTWKIGMTFAILISTVALCWLLHATYLILLNVFHKLSILMNSY
jgi:hypothetical protein